MIYEEPKGFMIHDNVMIIDNWHDFSFNVREKKLCNRVNMK